jgi:hypothetical protein
MFEYTVHGWTLASEMPLPELRASRASRPSVRIETRAACGPGPYDWFHQWRAGRRTCLKFARHEGGYLLRFPEMADFHVSAGGRRVRCHPRAGLPAETLRHLLIDQVLPLAIGRSRPLVLHASAVHVPRLGAVAFAGGTGQGKSTLAAALASHGCRMLSDDCVVIGGSPARPLALAGYPGVRLWRDSAAALGWRNGTRVAHYTPKRRVADSSVRFTPRPSPLKAIFVLDGRYATGPACRTREIGAAERLVAMTRFLYLMDVEDPRQLSRAFGALATLVQRVPVVRLRVVEDRRRLGEVADAIQQLVPWS